MTLSTRIRCALRHTESIKIHCFWETELEQFTRVPGWRSSKVGGWRGAVTSSSDQTRAETRRFPMEAK